MGLHGNIARAHLARTEYAMLDREAFAEAVSELGTVAAAARYIGVTERTGERHMREIKRGLGWQAQ